MAEWPMDHDGSNLVLGIRTLQQRHLSVGASQATKPQRKNAYIPSPRCWNDNPKRRPTDMLENNIPYAYEGSLYVGQSMERNLISARAPRSYLYMSTNCLFVVSTIWVNIELENSRISFGSDTIGLPDRWSLISSISCLI